jgi:hypothetical protein
VLRGSAPRAVYRLSTVSPDETCAYDERPLRRDASISEDAAEDEAPVYMPFVLIHYDTMVSPFGWESGLQTEGTDVVSRAYSIRMPSRRFERKARAALPLFRRFGWRRIAHRPAIGASRDAFRSR